MAKSSDSSIKGMYVKIGGDTSEYTAAMKSLNTDINATTKNLNNVNKLLKFDPTNVELASEKQKLLSEAIDATKAKLDVLIRNEKDINKLYAEGKIPTESYLKYQKELTTTQKKLDELRTPVVSAKAAFADMDSNIKTANDNLAKVRKLMELDPSSIKYAAEEQKLYTAAVEATEAKLKAVKEEELKVNALYKEGKVPTETYLEYQEELKKTQKQLDDLRNPTKSAEASTKQLAQGAKEAGNDVKDLGEKADKTGSIFKDVFTADLAVEGLKAIGNAAKEAAQSCSEVGIEFSTSMSNVAATMGMTAEDVSSGSESYLKLENAARECGETTKYTASESADALNYLALAGYDVNKSVETLPKVLNLATASGMDLATCTDMVTDTMSALQLETSDLDGYMDMMAKTAQKSNTTVSMLGEAILQCAGTVKSTGQDVDVMCTSLGVLANNGIKGAEGGTHLRNMLLSLTSPTDAASAKLKELGVSMTDSEGNIRSINDVFADLAHKLETLSDGDKTEALSDIFNKTDLSAVNAMLQGANGSFDELKTQVDNADGACQTMADTMNNNLKGKIAIMDSSLESLGITIFDKFSEPLENAAEVGSEVFSDLTKSIKDGDLSDEFDSMGEALGDFVETGAKFAKGSLPVLIKGIEFVCSHSNLVIGGLTGIAAAMITKKSVNTIIDLVGSFKSLINVTKGAEVAQQALNTAQKASPAGAIAAIVGTVIGGIVSYVSSTDDAAESTSVLNDKQQKLVDSTNELTDSLKSAAKQREEAKTDVEAEYSSYKTLADRVFKLSDAESLSNDQKAEMKALVDQLNSAIPDLNLQIDNQTGKLLNNKDAVYECIEATKEQLMVEAAQKDMVSISEALYKAEQKRAEIEEEIKDSKQKMIPIQEKMNKLNADWANVENEGEYWDLKDKYDKYASSVKDLEKSQKSVEKEIKKLNGEFSNASDYVSENASAIEKNAETVKDNAKAVDTLYNQTFMYKDGIHKVSRETIESIIDLNKSYDEAVSKRTEELQNNLNLFDEFNGGAEVSAEELMNNLESNLDGIADWSNNIEELADRGVNKGLIKTLQDAGPQSASKVKALLSMTQPELDKYSKMWEDTYGKCRTIAEQEYKSMEDDRDRAIETLLKRDQIAQISDVWEQTGAAMMLGMQQGIMSAQQEVINTASSGANAVLAAVKNVYGIHSPSREFAAIAGYNAQGEIKGWQEAEPNIIRAYAATGDKILSASELDGIGDTNRLARSVFNGSYASNITQKTTTNAAESTQAAPAVRQMPETIHNVIVFPSGKVIAEETVPFIDVMLGERAARKKRGSAV